MTLRHHPLEEVREIAISLEKALQKKYPSSFTHKRYEDTEEYLELSMKSYYYHNKKCDKFKLLKNLTDKSFFEDKEIQKILKKRPNGKTELPK